MMMGSMYGMKVAVFDKNHWLGKLEEMKRGGDVELIIKHYFSRGDQQTVSDMAYQLGLYFHAYNKGNALVVSKVPSPNYRVDLDERHGSAQKEVHMSSETERRVENLLDSSIGIEKIDSNFGTSVQRAKQSLHGSDKTNGISLLESDSAKKALSVELKERQEKQKESDRVKEMCQFREKLPAYKMKTELLNAVAKNQVLVVSGKTGYGKTTQLTQFILEEEISSLRGSDCNIICTQPRRISAISVAARISNERGENLGETVGYQIRLESKRSEQTRLFLCTTGVLLQKLFPDPSLTGVSHLLVD